MMRYQVNGRAARVASQSELNCDPTKTLRERMRDIPPERGPLRVQVLNAHTFGGGDLSFGQKFVQYLREMLDETGQDYRITYCLSSQRNTSKRFTSDPLRNALDATAQSRMVVGKARAQYNWNGTTHSASGAAVTDQGGWDDYFSRGSKIDVYLLRYDAARDRDVWDVRKNPIPTPDIAFIAPAAQRLRWDINYSNGTPERIYVCSEMNPSDRLGVKQAGKTYEISIASGLYNPRDCWSRSNNVCPVGVMIPPIKERALPQKIVEDLRPHGSSSSRRRPYAVTYFYASDNDLAESMREPSEVASLDIEQYLTDNAPANPDRPVPPEIGAYVDEKCQNLPAGPTRTTWYRSMLELTSLLVQFLADLEEWHATSGEKRKITVYHPPGTDIVRIFGRFCRFQETSDPMFPVLLRYLTDPKSIFRFKPQPRISPVEMLGFFQHALPYAMLSGDNTPVEFISANKNPFVYLYYQQFIWKRSVAESLGIQVLDDGGGLHATGKVVISREKFLMNAANNFSLSGSAQLNALIQAAIKGSPITCTNRPDRRWLLSERLYGPQPFLGFTGEAQGFVFGMTPTGARPPSDGEQAWINAQSQSTYGSGNFPRQLTFALDDNPMDENIVKGTMSKMSGGESGFGTVATTFMRSAAGLPSQIFIKYLNLDDPRRVALQDNCKSISYTITRQWNDPTCWDMTGPLPVCPIPTGISAMMTANLINSSIYQENRAEERGNGRVNNFGISNCLVKTLATLSDIPRRCSTGMAQNMARTVPDTAADRTPGVFLLQEFVPDSVMFRELFRCKSISRRQFCCIMATLTVTLCQLQKDYKFVHNDLWGANLMVSVQPKPVLFKTQVLAPGVSGSGYQQLNIEINTDLIAVIVDVDNAAFNFKGDPPAGPDPNRVRYISRAGYEHKARHFYNWFDLAYLIGDLLDIIDSNDYRDPATHSKCVRPEQFFTGTSETRDLEARKLGDMIRNLLIALFPTLFDRLKRQAATKPGMTEDQASNAAWRGLDRAVYTRNDVGKRVPQKTGNEAGQLSKYSDVTNLLSYLIRYSDPRAYRNFVPLLGAEKPIGVGPVAELPP